jgi:hypothetical protein
MATKVEAARRRRGPIPGRGPGPLGEASCPPRGARRRGSGAGGTASAAAPHIRSRAGSSPSAASRSSPASSRWPLSSHAASPCAQMPGCPVAPGRVRRPGRQVRSVRPRATPRCSQTLGTPRWSPSSTRAARMLRPGPAVPIERPPTVEEVHRRAPRRLAPRCVASAGGHRGRSRRGPSATGLGLPTVLSTRLSHRTNRSGAGRPPASLARAIAMRQKHERASVVRRVAQWTRSSSALRALRRQLPPTLKQLGVRKSSHNVHFGSYEYVEHEGMRRWITRFPRRRGDDPRPGPEEGRTAAGTRG